jgi:hypothetical protein
MQTSLLRSIAHDGNGLYGHMRLSLAYLNIGSSAPDKQAKNTKTASVSINKSGI